MNDARFSVSFAPSRPMSLDVTFAIEFAVELVDMAARAFRLKRVFVDQRRRSGSVDQSARSS